MLQMKHFHMEVNLTFQQALEKARSKKSDTKIKLLLGNGFSISLFNKIFSYQNLFEQAKEQGLFNKSSESLVKLFKDNNTCDFEHIMHILTHAESVLSTYHSVDKNLIKTIKADGEKLKEILIAAITKNHPDMPSEISEGQYSACFKFIKHFETIYSINYDLLLYWVVLKHLKKTKFTDGFHDPHTGEQDSEYYEEDYVSWQLSESQHAKLYYLHGSLHLYDADYEVRKYCWSRTGVKLKEQIVQALERGMFPLYIAEGDTQSKLEKINHSAYLSKGLRSLASCGSPLFVFGMSFKDNDQHIMDAIASSSISEVYISIYGDSNSIDNKKLSINIEKMVEKRKRLKNKNDLIINYYYSASAKIWG